MGTLVKERQKSTFIAMVKIDWSYTKTDFEPFFTEKVVLFMSYDSSDPQLEFMIEAHLPRVNHVFPPLGASFRDTDPRSGTQCMMEYQGGVLYCAFTAKACSFAYVRNHL